MNDKTIRQDVIDELNFVPSIDSAAIAVAVEDGVVTLTGKVPNYAQKHLAERAVRRVRGVRGIAEELKVTLDSPNPYSDDDIARRALTVLAINILVPMGAIQVQVEKGWLTLTGEVEWDYERTAAIADLTKLRGVVGISNNVTLKPRPSAPDIKQRIGDALKRTAEIELDQIKVAVIQGEVELSGAVHSLADRLSAERAAWSTPGVTAVRDRIHVRAH